MPKQDLILELFKSHLSIINVGIEKLIEHLSSYNVNVIQVDWKPPSGGKLEILRKLRNLTKQERRL
jgi:hypothetical protein